MESTSKEQPLVFCQGIGMMLPKFEEQVAGLKVGDTFDFTISHKDAYGEYDEECLMDLSRKIFEVDGKFDDDMIFEGNIVPLMDSEGNRLNAQVVAVSDDTVSVDLNHPLAGEDLHFIGEIIDVRAATEEEIASFTKRGCGCDCDCSTCDDDCETQNCCC